LFWDIYAILWDISGIGQGYDQVLDIPGISFEYFGISLGYPKTRKDIRVPKSEILEWDIPKLMSDKSRVSFFVLGYLSLSDPILVPIRFSKSCQCLAQSNDCYISLPTVHSAHAVHRAHVYLLVNSSSLALPTLRLFRRSGWGRPGRGQVTVCGAAAPTPHLHSGERGSMGASTPGPSALASASASSRRSELDGLPHSALGLGPARLTQ
jgi:hypothetical protein